MQYPVIYAVLSRLNCCNSYSSYFAVVLEDSQEESQKIDNLAILATCWSGTSAMLSSEVDGPVTYGSTQ